MWNIYDIEGFLYWVFCVCLVHGALNLCRGDEIMIARHSGERRVQGFLHWVMTSWRKTAQHSPESILRRLKYLILKWPSNSSTLNSEKSGSNDVSRRASKESMIASHRCCKWRRVSISVHDIFICCVQIKTSLKIVTF